MPACIECGTDPCICGLLNERKTLVQVNADLLKACKAIASTYRDADNPDDYLISREAVEQVCAAIAQSG